MQFEDSSSCPITSYLGKFLFPISFLWSLQSFHLPQLVSCPVSSSPFSVSLGLRTGIRLGLTQHHSTFGRDLAEMSPSRRGGGSKYMEQTTSGLEDLGPILLPLKVVGVKTENTSGYHTRYGKILIHPQLPFKEISSPWISCLSS